MMGTWLLLAVLTTAEAPHLPATNQSPSITRGQRTVTKNAEPATFPVTDTLDLIEKLLKILAYLFGAGWVYFNYFRGRTYRPRLEPAINAELRRRSTPEFILASVRVKNVGLSRVKIRQDGTGLRFSVYDPAAEQGWRYLTTASVFERHQWVEPGETIEDHVLVPRDLTNIPAVRLHLIVGSKGVMWNAVTIAT